jgi:hypothetical protein
MLNRVTFVGIAIAFGTAFFVGLLVNSRTGPGVSRSDLASTSISIEDLYRKVDHTRLPIHSAPEL